MKALKHNYFLEAGASVHFFLVSVFFSLSLHRLAHFAEASRPRASNKLFMVYRNQTSLIISSGVRIVREC